MITYKLKKNYTTKRKQKQQCNKTATKQTHTTTINTNIYKKKHNKQKRPNQPHTKQNETTTKK